MPNPHVIDMDLSRVAESDRVAVWTQWSAETFSNIVVSDCPGGTLDGFIRGVTLGAGRLLKVRSPGRRLVRKPVPQVEPALTVVLQLTGVSHIDQGLRSCTLTAGDISVTDGLYPFQQQVSYASELMLLQLPRELTAARYSALVLCSAHAYPACQPAAGLVRSTLDAAFQTAQHLSAVQRERLCHALFAVACLLPGDHAPLASGDHHRQRAALTEIEEHLGEHVLSAQFVASRAGLSRRRLDEIFVKHFGCPVTAYIWERRLERAKDMLQDDGYAGRTITEIALTVGFEDASHFSRAFKNRFGAAPSAWRSRSSGFVANG
jgi:AraC-like DNA-binding protein